MCNLDLFRAFYNCLTLNKQQSCLILFLDPKSQPLLLRTSLAFGAKLQQLLTGLELEAKKLEYSLTLKMAAAVDCR